MKYSGIICTLLVCIGIACSPKLNMQFQRTGLVTSIKHDRMTLHLNSESNADSFGKAASFAERNAFENLLFKGVPNSNQERPLISNEAKVKRDFPDFFNSFIINRGFENYMMSSNVVEHFQNNNVHIVTVEMQVDLNNLRKQLENQGIIKSFGI